jgi:hypothetical protein
MPVATRLGRRTSDDTDGCDDDAGAGPRCRYLPDLHHLRKSIARCDRGPHTGCGYARGAGSSTGSCDTVQANIYALNGTVWLKSKTQATGAFIGQHLRIGQRVKLALDSAFD